MTTTALHFLACDPAQTRGPNDDHRGQNETAGKGCRHGALPVQLVRAYLSYWRQTGSKFSVRYMAETLRQRADLVKELVEGFIQRFDPSLPATHRADAVERIGAIKDSLAAVNHADTEDILATLADLVLATVRTNYFQSGQQGDKIIFKFDSSGLALLPEPRPYREIYVFARRFEGVHLRGGPVARGGLRWSDRMEDYRTEVLGLVKAQMVKNAVIVPAGSKGGFVCKHMPKDAGRDTIAAEGEAVYRLFISSLLEVTDNRVHGEIIAPADTVRYDKDDPYLVVAADKGTATFSDIANSIAVERGFWLGDAFASGGSNGYDHKKMGITAKGAFEAVKRHFYEMDHNIDSTPFTVAGVGDMSGDVFGNGVPTLMDRLLEANRLEKGAVTMSRLEETPATVAFLAGKLDALVFASAPESLMVQMLLQTPGVQLLDIAQHEAYARRFPFLSPVTLPRGVVDLASNVPARDVRSAQRGQVAGLLL
eukprot:gene35348-43586_t